MVRNPKIVFSISIFYLFLFLLAGCSNMENQVQTKGGLKIDSWNSALGSVDDTNLDKTKFSYSVNLTNENQNAIFIKSIQPSVNEKIKDKILSKDTAVIINKELKPNETMQINGELIIDTKGLSKSEIVKFEPFITEIKVSSEEIIRLK